MKTTLAPIFSPVWRSYRDGRHEAHPIRWVFVYFPLLTLLVFLIGIAAIIATIAWAFGAYSNHLHPLGRHHARPVSPITTIKELLK